MQPAWGQAYAPAVPGTAWPLAWGEIQKAGRHRKDARRTSKCCLLSPLYGAVSSSVFQNWQGAWNLVSYSSGFQPVFLSQAVQTISWSRENHLEIWIFSQFYFVKRRKGAQAGFNVLSTDNNFDFILRGGRQCLQCGHESHRTMTVKRKMIFSQTAWWGWTGLLICTIPSGTLYTVVYFNGISPIAVHNLSSRTWWPCVVTPGMCGLLDLLSQSWLPD